MRFRHKRTGRIIDVTDSEAFRYSNSRYEVLHEHMAGNPDWGPGNVPRGTVAEVLAWVGDDDLRRQSALTVERAGKNRKSLIEALT